MKGAELSGVLGYSATKGGWVDGKSWISQDCQSYFGVLGYSAPEGGWVDGKSWTVRVTWVYRDTLPQIEGGWVDGKSGDIPGVL